MEAVDTSFSCFIPIKAERRKNLGFSFDLIDTSSTIQGNRYNLMKNLMESGT